MNFFDSSDIRRLTEDPAATMAARCLSAVLKKHNIATPYFLDRTSSAIRLPEELKARQRPLFFALSLYDRSFEEAQAEVKAIKREYPRAKILLGGPSVNTTSDLRSLATFFPEVDALVKGDGEAVIADLVYALSTDPIDRERIAGLQGVYVKSPDFEFEDERTNRLGAPELNAQPGLTAYPALVGDIRRQGFLDLHTSRGCKYRCIFCSHKYFTRPIYWTADRIIQELARIKTMVEQGILPVQARLIRFTDDDFFQDRERAVEFLRKAAADPSLKHFFRFIFQGSVGSFFQAKRLDEKLLNLLAKVRTVDVKLGTDGFHPEALKYLKKGGYTWKMALKLMAGLARRNIHQTHYVILTFPTMTGKILAETLFNIYNVMEYIERNLSLQISVFPIAYESNALMDVAERITEPRVLSAGETAKKLLPIALPIEDPLVLKALDLVLDMAFPDERSLLRLARKSRRYREKKELIGIAKELRKTGDGKIDLFRALHSRNQLINKYALGIMLLGLKGVFPEAAQPAKTGLEA